MRALRRGDHFAGVLAEVGGWGDGGLHEEALQTGEEFALEERQCWT